VAEAKRRAYRDWTYWGKPVPGFGDPRARLLLVGLAPGAHGANRTGRMFTGDGSGDFLYRALHETGFASQPESVSTGDGLRLRDAWITAAARCAPPQNKPTPEEFSNCSCFLERELLLLHHVQVVVALGRLALDAYLAVLKRNHRIERRAAYGFAHGALHGLPGGLPALLCSYHPSRQNTQTGRLTASMLHQVFMTARQLLR
jgi:uracil-DNA glycosylase family 4